MKLSDYVIDFLYSHGVRHVFGLVGGGAMHLFDSLGKCKNIELVCNLHEQGAGFAACQYAAYTGKPSVCMVTTGPGGTNAITPCLAAWNDGYPVVFISGQVSRSQMMIDYPGLRSRGPQESNIVGLVRHITKWANVIWRAEDITRLLPAAWAISCSDRHGPVWIDIPLDVQAAEIEYCEDWREEPIA